MSSNENMNDIDISLINTNFFDNYFNNNCKYEQNNNKKEINNHGNFIKIRTPDKIIIINLNSKIQIFLNNKFINIDKLDVIYFKNITFYKFSNFKNIPFHRYYIILKKYNTEDTHIIFNHTDKKLFFENINNFLIYFQMEYSSSMNILD